MTKLKRQLDKLCAQKAASKANAENRCSDVLLNGSKASSSKKGVGGIRPANKTTKKKASKESDDGEDEDGKSVSSSSDDSDDEDDSEEDELEGTGEGKTGCRTQKTTKSSKSAEDANQKSSKKQGVTNQGAGEQNESVNDDNESDDDIDPSSVEIVKYSWETNRETKGNFMVRFKGDDTDTRLSVKELLCDFPDLGLFYIFDKYVHQARTVHYVERCARGYYESKEVAKRKVIKGFISIRDYARRRGWVSQSDMRRNMNRRLMYPHYDRIVPEKNISKKRKDGPRNETGGESELESVKVSDVEPRQGKSVVEEAEEGGGGTLVQAVVVEEEEEPGVNTALGVSEPCQVTAELELNAGEALVETGQHGYNTPSKVGAVDYSQPVETGGGPCASLDYTSNHRWEELRTSNYVITGCLEGGKRCIGVNEEGRACGRLFVASRLDNKKDISETECRPAAKNPVYNCTRCAFAMCLPCKLYYEGNVRQPSPSRKRKKVNRQLGGWS